MSSVLPKSVKELDTISSRVHTENYLGELNPEAISRERSPMSRRFTSKEKKS
ncbi:MAG: hypothetical protein SPK50_01815 [Mobiluncus porci]|nr:hypothetical protein [Mobiluncus sp.]MDD7541374.1 hypothetical protein [Mobiluncus porci]MDY5747857.1 hypothetical protein [Mobiluncus porci]